MTRDDQDASGGDVLIVDDERVLAETAAIILRHYGVPARTAFRGYSAIAAVREKAPALVLMNVGLPDDGVSTARQIRASFPNVRIVMHTGSIANAQYAIENGFDELIPKPFHPSELLRLVQKYGFKPKAPPGRPPVPPYAPDSG